jgi:hypothetical protein
MKDKLACVFSKKAKMTLILIKNDHGTGIVLFEVEVEA